MTSGSRPSSRHRELFASNRIAGLALSAYHSGTIQSNRPRLDVAAAQIVVRLDFSQRTVECSAAVERATSKVDCY